MKRLKTIIAAILVFTFLIPCAAMYSAVDAQCLYGDVNGDGTLTGVDAYLLTKLIVGYIGEDINTENADINKDGYLNAIDQNYMKRIMVGDDIVIVENSLSGIASESTALSLNYAVDGNISVPTNASAKDAFGSSVKYIITKSGKKLVHTYSDRSIDNSEDNSVTVGFDPMISTTTFPSYGEAYNMPKIMLEDLKPGTISDGVFVGYDGYLFYNDSINDFIGKGRLAKSMYSNTVDLFSNIKKWSERNGKKFYVVIAPNKNSVYGDYMPEGYTMGEYRRIDQFDEIMTDAGVEFIDLRKALCASRDNAPERNLYHKYNTHWNQHAGFIAYEETMKMIQKDFPSVVVHDKGDFQINYMETYMKDMAWYLGYYSAFKEYAPQYTLKSEKTARLIDYEPKNTWGQYQFAYVDDEGYSDKLYWFKYRNEYNADAPSVYCLRDQASIAMLPFLKDSFYESTYNWTFSFEKNKNDIMSSGADVILMIISERSLRNVVNQFDVTP